MSIAPAAADRRTTSTFPTAIVVGALVDVQPMAPAMNVGVTVNALACEGDEAVYFDPPPNPGVMRCHRQTGQWVPLPWHTGVVAFVLQTLF
jgi:hypothetical protein